MHLTLPSLAVLSLPIAFSGRAGLMYMTFPDPSVHLWGAESAAGSAGAVLWALGIVMALFAGVVAVTACAGAALGHLLQGSPGLGAYSADLVGSLLGVLAMSAITALGATPPVWLALAALPFAWLSRTATSLLSLVLVVGLGQASVAGAVYSPYNRIDIFDSPFGATMAVNRDFHQYMHDLRDVAGDETRRRVKEMYDIPFRLGPERARALVVGAGTGNDVQAALRNDAVSVTSVEIDGRILAIGRERHPEHPYSDPRVVAVVNDARAFFEQYRGEPFDVIDYGLVDSHAMFSSLSTLRLDNYLYTEQGLRAAFSHLKPDGVMTVNLSFIGGPWMQRRLNFTLARATGTQPVIVDHGLHGAATLVASRDPAALHFERVPDFPHHVLPPVAARGVLTTSDDWPFLYLRPGAVPWGYLLVLACVLALAFLLVSAVHGGRALRLGFDPALFLMGAGFLLVEARGVTTLSLLFGSTWVVNAAVFSGVLIMALVANVAVQRLRPASSLPGFVLLLGALVALWMLDVAALNRFSLLARGLLGGVLNALPVGFAGLIVSTLLARSRDLASALASNLLGSVLGGCLEYVSMWSGLRALVLLAIGLYLGALLLELRRAPVTPGSAAATGSG